MARAYESAQVERHADCIGSGSFSKAIRAARESRGREAGSLSRARTLPRRRQPYPSRWRQPPRRGSQHTGRRESLAGKAPPERPALALPRALRAWAGRQVPRRILLHFAHGSTQFSRAPRKHRRGDRGSASPSPSRPKEAQQISPGHRPECPATSRAIWKGRQKAPTPREVANNAIIAFVSILWYRC
jgi:hypothetical protein